MYKNSFKKSAEDIRVNVERKNVSYTNYIKANINEFHKMKNKAKVV